MSLILFEISEHQQDFTCCRQNGPRRKKKRTGRRKRERSCTEYSNNGIYRVKSFTAEGLFHEIEVLNQETKTCSCGYFKWNRIACNHMYLLRHLHTSIRLHQEFTNEQICNVSETVNILSSALQGSSDLASNSNFNTQRQIYELFFLDCFQVVKQICSPDYHCFDNYRVGDAEWSDGSRSDILYETLDKSLKQPPVTVEVERTVDFNLMARVVHYCVMAYRRYQTFPVVFILALKHVSIPTENMRLYRICLVNNTSMNYFVKLQTSPKVDPRGLQNI
ncbi:hypothetical protein BY458DRAFT_494491 [Sporodiniella umbellata]|nr:hypothetical protein BY458DRAFT_494491 [Sporodiniella umbellata]